MDTPRRSRRTASFLLAWFLAFLVVAGAAPWLQDPSLQDVCTIETVAQDADTGAEADRHTVHPLECALCAGISGPPAALAVLPQGDAPLGYVLRPIVSAQLASLTAAPLPARGPPLLS